MIDLIRTLCNAFGPVGNEDAVRAMITEFVAPHVDEVRTDALGNLIVRKSGRQNSDRIMLSAHMDEIGIMVTHVDDKGFLRFHPLGGIRPHTLLGQRVRFHDGTVGSVGCERLDDIKDLQFDRMFIDIGVTSQAQALERVRIGDTACFDQSLVVQGNRLTGKALDDRVGCAVLIETLRRVPKPVSDVYGVFSVQEEVGARGAGVAAFGIEPTLGIAIDVTPTGDTPEGDKLPVKLGDGVAIKVKDRSMLTHPRVKDHLSDLARQSQLKHQYEVLAYGGTDAGPIHTSRAGVPSGGISIPLRYLHSPAELADLGDIEAAVGLTCALLESDLPSFG